MKDGRRGIAVLGSTGSIGTQTLDIVRAFPKRLRVVGLSAGRNAELLQAQIREFAPTVVHCLDPRDLDLRGATLASPEEVTTHPDVDVVMGGMVGQAGLAPMLAAVGAGKAVAPANKEVLVMAGEALTAAAAASGATILPVDSEHNAIWQCLRSDSVELRASDQVERLILTASGGPFLTTSLAEMRQASAAQALSHPNWRMGRKITTDSATLMNKGLEVIEAHWLFGVPYEKISILIHPQSVVHSLVEFIDGSIVAQLGPHDMHMPIQYALSWPERWVNAALPRLDLSRVGALEFAEPDEERFPALRLAREAASAGGTYPAVLCGADEAAVELFLSGRIGFMDIPRLVETVLEQHRATVQPDLAHIAAAAAWASGRTEELAASAVS